MTQDEALTLLARVTYKPGWTVLGVRRGDEELELRVCPPVWADSGGTSWAHDISLTHVINLRNCESDLAFLNVVRHVVWRMEEHELNEWLRYDGARMFPAHSRLAAMA